MKQRAAGLIRIVTAPPVMALLLIVLLCLSGANVFSCTGEIVAAALGIVVLPLSAYPLQAALPAFRNEGRSGQRRLAFILTLLGYSLFAVFALACGQTRPIKQLALGYLLSVLCLTAINAWTPLHASGHSCGFTASLCYIVLFRSRYWILPGVLMSLLMVWSSLILKRHTGAELLLGAATFLLAFVTANALPL